MNHLNPTAAVYHVSPMRQGLFLLPWGLIALPLLIGGIATQEAALLVAAVVMSLIYAPLAYLVCIYTRLILSADGVDLRQLGYRLQSTWDNIEALDLTRRAEGFILREPMAGKGAIRLANASGVRIVVGGAAMPTYTGGRQDLVAQLKFIPIEPFAYWLKRGDLADAIGRHAPRLVEDPTALPSPPASKPLSPRAKALMALLIVGSLALGLALATGTFDRAAEIWVYRIMQGAAGAAMGAYSIVNLVSLWLYARSGRWGWACASLLFAILTFCGMLAAFGSLP